MDLYFLKTKNGKSFQVKQYEDKPQLCVVDSQDSAAEVKIEKRNETQMAFGFVYEGECYFQKASGDALELVKADSLDSDSYWFEKQNIGGSEHYGLRTVAEPQRYLATLNAPRSCRLGLSHEIILLITIKDYEHHFQMVTGTIRGLKILLQPMTSDSSKFPLAN